MTDYVHGSTDAREIARLEKQADFIAPFSFPPLELSAGLRLLDLATGVGAMATRLLRAMPSLKLVGVDLSPTQLAAARRHHPEVTTLRADATRLPFADDTFDRVHCSWLLEHVPTPVPIVQEVRRVLKPGGHCVFIEVQNSTFSMSPRSEAVHEALERLAVAQRAAGGDPDVGFRLESIFGGAGFTRVAIDRPLMHGTETNPAFRQQFIDEFSEIFEGLDESLGPDALQLLTRAAADLRALPSVKGELQYTPAIARGWK